MLPSDPLILLGVVNTKLRDFYPTLDALCEDLGEDKEKICQKLKIIDYVYDEKLNKFV